MDTVDMGPREVADLLTREDIQLIDVREPYEHEAGHIAGSRLITLGDLPAEARTIDRARPVIVYCRSGGRSAMAVQALRGAGWDARNMTGGLLEWEAAGLPLEPDGGQVAGH